MSLSIAGGTVHNRPTELEPIKQTQKWTSIVNDQCVGTLGVPATAATQIIGIVADEDTTLIVLRIPLNAIVCFGEVKDTLSEFFLVNEDS